MTQFAAANKASAETLFGLTSQAFEGVEKLTTLNLQTVKTLMEEFAADTRAAFSAKTPEEFFKLQATVLKAAPQKAAAYGRQVKEIFAATTATQRAAAEAQLADVQAKFLEAVNGALKNAPGSENTIVLVKSAVAAANSALENVSKASKQMSDAVEANVTKFTETATKALPASFTKLAA